jgi:DeoR-like helix-turn-helix domain
MSSSTQSTSRFQIVSDTPGTWVLALDDLSVTFTGVIHDRGCVRVTVRVHRAGQPVFSEKVNLTSSQSRKKFLKEAQRVAGAEIPEGALLAVEEVVHRSGGRPVREQVDGCGDFSGKVPATFAEVQALVEEYLLVDDRDLLAVLLASVAAHRLGVDPVWLLLVGPSSSGKTEFLRLVGCVRGVYPLSDLTPRTLASGLVVPGGDPSLLASLKDEILVVKDMTTVLSLKPDDRQAILAQLREVYDGSFVKAWGTGKKLTWKGRLGFLAGVTEVIDKHHGVMAILGQRFVLLRLRQPARTRVGRRALDNIRKPGAADLLAGAIGAFIQQLPTDSPDASEAVQDRLVQIADIVTRARSAVERGGYKHELDYAPEPEMPGRFARQLASLVRGLALLDRRTEINDDDLRIVARVGLDCIPPVRLLALRELAGHEEDLATSAVAQQVEYSTSTVRRALEDLQALGMVTCTQGGAGVASKWRLKDEYRVVLGTIIDSGDGRERGDGAPSARQDPPPAPGEAAKCSPTVPPDARARMRDSGFADDVVGAMGAKGVAEYLAGQDAGNAVDPTRPLV